MYYYKNNKNKKVCMYFYFFDKQHYDPHFIMLDVMSLLIFI